MSERLPQLRTQAELLFEGDETFRELCEEYQVCNEAAARMAGAEATSTALRNEYLALRLRLEGELLRYMAERSDA